jgi:hypothetical protein
MAPKPVKNKRRTAAFYASNPDARKKKAAYDKRYHSTPERKKYRAALAAERRARRIDGKGGGDLSHTTDGSLKREAPSRNRARNGSGGRRRLASGGRRTRR